jgi:hypothetical protein
MAHANILRAQDVLQDRRDTAPSMPISSLVGGMLVG